MLALPLLVMLVASTGCVTRRLIVNSNPPGALVYVDNQEIGTTPVASRFTYYGTREIRLERDGYETLSISQTFKPRWYQWPGIDFIAENLWPGEIRDERVVELNMMPQQIITTDDLLQRGEMLRNASTTGAVAPSPQSLPGEVGPPRFSPTLPAGQPTIPSGTIPTLEPPQQAPPAGNVMRPPRY